MEQVVCVDDSLPKCVVWSGDPVVRGCVYTVRERLVSPPGFEDAGVLGVYLEEARRGVRECGTEEGYLASRFVPIRDESIEVFREIARKVPERKTERV